MRCPAAFLLFAALVAVPLATRAGLVWAESAPAVRSPGSLAPLQPRAPAGQDLRLRYAILIQEARDSRDALEEEIGKIEEQIEALKKLVMKIKLLLSKLEELLPKFLGRAGSGAGGPGGPPGGAAAFAGVIRQELQRVGVGLSAETAQALAAEILHGGQGGVAVALYIALSVAELAADAALSQPERHTLAFDALAGGSATLGGRPDASAPSPAPDLLQALLSSLSFLRLGPRDVSLASSLSGPVASAFISGRINGQCTARISSVNKEIYGKKKKIDSLRTQIAELDEEIEHLQAELARRGSKTRSIPGSR